MYRRETITQMQANVQGIIPVFHKTQHRNLTMMVIGIVMAKSVQLTKIAPEVAIDRISHEAYVQRFERLMACEKFDVREVMKAIATRVLQYITRWQAPLVLVMDRSMINNTLNLLHVAVAFGKRALPLGWVEVPHEGSSWQGGLRPRWERTMCCASKRKPGWKSMDNGSGREVWPSKVNPTGISTSW